MRCERRALDATSTVKFEVKLAFESVIDRLDELANGFQEVHHASLAVAVEGRSRRTPWPARWLSSSAET